MSGQFLFEGMVEPKTSSKGTKYSNIYIKEIDENGEPKMEQQKYPIFGDELCDAFSKIEKNSIIEIDYDVKDISINRVNVYA